MNPKHKAVIAGAVLFLPILVHAEPAVAGENSTWGNLLWGVAPFVIMILVFLWFIRRMQGSKNPRIRRYDEHMARQLQHMERVEQGLERIAKLLEKKD
jgi:hypothetical protein